MADLPAPTLRLNIDLEALSSNWHTLDRLSREAQAGAAVKADAYGLGVDRVLPTLCQAGAREYFVAHWSEVLPVAAHCDPANISVLHGPLSSDDVCFARETGVVPVINSLEQASRWLESGGGRCHLMVDTGINRLGLPMAELSDPLIDRLDIDILMSHLASADENSPQNDIQRQRFEQVIAAIPAQRYSLANSAGIALGSDYAYDLTRPGLALYGGVPRQEFTGIIRQVAFLQAAILQTRLLQPGDQVGYNGEFTAAQPMYVGVVSLGYADGFLRTWDGANVLGEGMRELPLLGKISMDMIVIDLGKAPELREGDWVDIPYDLPKAALQTGLSQYELLTVLGQRFGRG